MAIPFYVITFNRVSGLENAFRFTIRSTLELELIVLDMGSTYAPFWDYVNRMGFQFHSYSLALGPRQLWTEGHLQKLGSSPFFISDGDIDYDLVDSTAFQKMSELSLKYPWIPKVGLALDIKQLPEDEEGQRIKSWERWNWEFEIEKDVYLAGLDTTIAFYQTRSRNFFYRPALRLGGCLTANHYPWHERENTFSEEVRFYHSKASNVISTTATGTHKSFQTRVKFGILFQMFKVLKYIIRTQKFGPLAVKILSFRGRFVRLRINMFL